MVFSFFKKKLEKMPEREVVRPKAAVAPKPLESVPPAPEEEARKAPEPLPDLDRLGSPYLAGILDAVDPERRRDLCFGTPDSWIVWQLTEGAHHVSDLTNAAIWGLLLPDGSHYDVAVLDRLRIPASMLPRIVDSSGHIGPATALDGAPPVCSIVGDQQASLIGQGCVRPGTAKVTFGTGGKIAVFAGYVGFDNAPGGSAQDKVTSQAVITANGRPTYYAS